MDKQQAKEFRALGIKKLVERYEKLSDAEKKKYNEQQTKDHFIRPLFELLGWNFETDVWSETDVHRKRVDYAFMLGGLTKFYVEAKSLKTDLDIETHAKQAINYAWNKGVAWAVLTDFEGIKIFNAQAQSKLLQDKLVFEIPYSEYVSDFARLWLLSKESFEKNGLDQYAVKHGKKIKKLTVNEKLYGDFKKAREILTKSFGEWNENIDRETLDEGVQRILDRLVFIRVLEDRGLEEPTLKPMIRKWETDGKKEQLFQIMIEKFRELDDIYNSNLFKEHSCEKWEEYDDKIVQVINMLYGSHVYEYDFKEIPADILGGVYESYLGYIAQNPIKAGKQEKEKDKKEIKTKSRQKRKEQGIYYTPKFIVDYIVENTLGKKLEEVKSMHELKQIKVLDPACGSGSFLTKALKTINDKYKDFGNPGKQDTKSEILLSNIYGVDLDPQAVELAKLNLLVSALDEKAKLPDLTGNVRVGNSLISGSEQELKKYFGKNWRDKRPFNWEEEFPFCHSIEKGNPGFDVVIGNPPYVDVRKIEENDKKYLFNNFFCAENRTNTFSIFIEKSISLLNQGGYLGFIIPNTILTHSSYKKLRLKILNECIISAVYDLGKNVFKDATVETIVLILKTEKRDVKRNRNLINVCKNNKNGYVNCFHIEQSLFLLDHTHRFVLSNNEKINNIINKLKSISINLGNIYHGFNGINPGNQRNKVVADNKVDNRYKKVIDGKHIKRYLIEWGGDWILYDKKILERSRKEEIFLTKPKIILQKIGTGLVAGLDENQLYSLINTTILLKIDGEYNQKYILALLNSKLLNFYYKIEFLGVQIKTEFLEFLPIYKINFSNKKEKSQHDGLVKLVDKILKLNKQLQSIPENSDKWNSVKKEIEKMDKEIDKRVFELYGLTEEERKVIEK